ncbi:EamA family transporter RarD [Ralstonia solanacearum P673]|uniref:EamA family transporter RarD n=1 Tax=Ralstonia solanacearum TaxID=305 RepID=UPI000450C6D0|nr:EamA family transporter RarD [Ralstonia solanacearum]EUJ13900.1 membrane protein [Ralstonia solanacearum P673]MCL9850154.1 EamA family transporter RarD [Ralstonia solanacearum]MCL9855492.1 EamA family transporter RarD [Ralstonia solanacearum]MCL9858156.1 EamA family transporter RarD [Ralstonia solanacearum]MCL9865380.1 EamA family transporter RarD [Ralstonia solanacearum]
MSAHARRGVIFALLAYTMWGLFPLYFKLLKSVTPLEILSHRVIWSLAVMVGVLAVKRHWAWLWALRRAPRVVARHLASTAMLALNWCTYIWAVNHDHVIDASLGYFINPLVVVMLALLVLGERLRPGQWLSVALAAAGVAWLTWQAGHLPWIALALAVTFGLYGLLRKTSPLGALEGLTLETLLLFPATLVYLGWLAAQQQNAFLGAPPGIRLLLVLAGPLTAVPLLLFGAGARRIPLSLLGLLQYVSPTLQLLLGVWLYSEPFGGPKVFGYVLIWCGLAVYSAEGWMRLRRRGPAAA